MGGVIVQAQELGGLLGVRGAALDELGGPGVQRPAHPEGQRLVGRVARERVAEAHDVRGDGHQEVVQPPDRDTHVLGREPQQLPEDVRVRPDAEDGGLAQQRAVLGRQRVDARGDQRLDALGQVGQLPARRPGGGHELGEEQRIAGRTLDELRPAARRQRDPGVRQQPFGGRDVQRLDREARDAVLGGEVEPAGAGAAADDREPAGTARPAHEVRQQIAGRLVEPVGVLDDQQQHAGVRHRVQQRQRGAVQPGAGEVRAQPPRRLRGRARARRGWQAAAARRAPAGASRRAPAAPSRSPGRRGGPRRAASAAARAGPGTGSRHRRSARRCAGWRVGRDVAQGVGHEGGLADSRLADELDRAAGALAGVREQLGDDGQLLLPAVQCGLGSGFARSRVLGDLADDRGVDVVRPCP